MYQEYIASNSTIIWENGNWGKDMAEFFLRAPFLSIFFWEFGEHVLAYGRAWEASPCCFAERDGAWGIGKSPLACSYIEKKQHDCIYTWLHNNLTWGGLFA